MAKKPNFYALLGLLRSSTQEEIRRAYLKAAKRLHPDTNNAPGETELFLDVQQAYQVLSDPARRSSYDAKLEPDAVLEKEICKPNCKLCISSCPSEALTQSGVEQLKCRPYSAGKTSKGDSIYTCNVCRSICPNVFGFDHKEQSTVLLG